MKPMKRRSCLTLFLILIAVVNLFTAISFAVTLVQSSQSTPVAPWMIGFSIGVCIVNVACAVGVWFWKRWGIIGYGLVALISYLVNGFTTGNYLNLIGLAGSSLLVVLILPYWKEMRWA